MVLCQVGEVGLLDPKRSSTCKHTIQQLDDGVEGGGFLTVVQVEVFHKSPCWTLETADDVQQHGLIPFRQSHLSVVDVDPFPPLLVVGRLAWKQGDETVSGGIASAEVSCLADPEAMLHNVQGELQKGELVYALRVDQTVEASQEFSPKRSPARTQ